MPLLRFLEVFDGFEVDSFIRSNPPVWLDGKAVCSTSCSNDISMRPPNVASASVLSADDLATMNARVAQLEGREKFTPRVNPSQSFALSLKRKPPQTALLSIQVSHAHGHFETRVCRGWAATLDISSYRRYD
eukprot:COSAG02_NODE_870_length_16337_cov_45.593608_2_plen_132_part_00